MLNQDINTLQNTVEAANETAMNVTPVAPVATAPVTPRYHSNLSNLVGAFQRELGSGVLPAEATTSCTIMGSSIKFGNQMSLDAGDYLVIEPLNITPYSKVNLGVSGTLSPEEQRLQVNCYDGQTVVFDEVSYSKAEFLELLKQRGYSKAAFNDRAVLHGYYITCDRADKVHVSEDDRLFAVYLSKTSYKALQGFIMKSALSGSGDNKPYIKLTKESKGFNGVNWTQFAFAREAA